MEWNGFAIDVPYFQSQAAIAAADQAESRTKLKQLLNSVGVKSDDPDAIWTSGPQTIKLLHEDLGLPPSPVWFKGRVRVDAGERKTDRVAMEWVESHSPAGNARDVVTELMNLRRIISSAKYLNKLPQYVAPDGFVHTVCGPAGDDDDRVGAITGRLAMKKPEAAQIPRDKRKDRYHVRAGFVAPPGMKLVVRDYTALEVVIKANIAELLWGDTLLLELTAPGQDIHAYNAHKVFGEILKWNTPSGRPVASYAPGEFKGNPELDWFREAIKAVWYKLEYGGTVHGFSTSLKDQAGNPVGLARAEEIVGALYEAVPAIPKFQTWVGEVLERDGGICAWDGRYADYSALIARDPPGTRLEKRWGFAAAQRAAQNFPMQAFGAHVIGCAMVDALNCPELAHLGAVQELQVHDELRWRCPAGNEGRVGALADEIMSGAFPLKNLRTAGGSGDNWEQCK